jgi:hypothetical protein
VAATSEIPAIIEGNTYSGNLNYSGYQGSNSNLETVYGGQITVRPPFQGSEIFFDELTSGQATMQHEVSTQSASVVRIEVAESDEVRASYKIAGFASRLIEKLNSIENGQ